MYPRMSAAILPAHSPARHFKWELAASPSFVAHHPHHRSVDFSRAFINYSHFPLIGLLGLHLGASSSPSIPSSAEILPHSQTHEPCQTLRGSRGLMILMPRRSHTTCTFRRRPVSLEFPLARFSMVHPIHPLTRPYTRTHSVCLLCSRGCCRAVFQMHGRPT